MSLRAAPHVISGKRLLPLCCALMACALGWGVAPLSAQPTPIAPKPMATSSPGVQAARELMHKAQAKALEASLLMPGARALSSASASVEAARTRAAELELSGLPLRELTLECNEPVCDSSQEKLLLLELVGLRPGMPFSRELQLRVRERLLKTGIFKEPRFYIHLTPERQIDLTITLERALVIRAIRFEGMRPPPFVEDFERVLNYREGQRWQDDESRQSDQLKAMDEVLQKEGYFDAKINMITHREGHSIDLTFRMEKGKNLKICQFGVRGVREFPYADVRARVFSALPIWTRYLNFIKPIYTERTLRAGEEALLTAYRARGYYQARVVDKIVQPDERDPTCVRVLIGVQEGARWKIVFTGNTAITKQELSLQLSFQTTGYVDAAAIDAAARKLEKIYATRGYPFASVRGEEVYGEDRLDRKIVFEVEEGDRYEIRRVVLEDQQGRPRAASSVEGLGDDALREKMGTQPFGLFESGGYLQLEELEADITRIEETYHERGFIEATVSEFMVIPDHTEKALTVRIRIDEGPRSVVSKIELPGATPTITSITSLREGQPLSLLQARADGSRLSQRLASRGHPMASVITTCHAPEGTPRACEQPRRAPGCELERVAPATTTTEPEQARTRRYRRDLSAQACAWTAPPYGNRVIVTHETVTGPSFRVGAILLNGNFVTRSDVIFGELPLDTGDVFDVKRLLEGQARLRSLGLFDSVSIEAIGLDEGALLEEDASAALVISVDEGEYYYFDVSVGFQGRDLLDNTRRKLLAVGDVQYNNLNLFGRAQRFQPRALLAVDTLQLAQLGVATQSGLLDREEISSRFDFLTGIELVYVHPRFLKLATGVEELRLTVAPYALLDLVGVTNNNLQREEFGARAAVRKELAELLERFFITLGLEGKSVATRVPESGVVDEQGRRLFSPRRIVGKLYVDISIDRRNSPLNPTKGFYLQLSPQLVNSDALTRNLAQAFQDNLGGALTNSFFRLSFSSSGYKSWGKVTFGQSFRYGQIFPLVARNLPVPADERYVLGGVTSLRGFPESGVNSNVPSYKDLQRGGEFVMNTNTEVRYPLIERYGLFGATFVDVGVLADCFDDQNITASTSCYRDAFPSQAPLSKVRSSAGFGVRYLVADQIPLLLDYAMLLNRKPGESFSYLHFNVGYTF